jgi:hypothetical protein
MQNKNGQSLNAVKHGLTSTKMFVLQNESPEQWNKMLAECIEEFKPETPFEERLVEEIAYAQWRLRRAWVTENALYDSEMDDNAEAFAAKYTNADEGVRQGNAFRSMADRSKALPLVMRYESRLDRAYKRAIRTLEDRRLARNRRAS